MLNIRKYLKILTWLFGFSLIFGLLFLNVNQWVILLCIIFLIICGFKAFGYFLTPKYPKWYLLLKKECRPSGEKVWKLENLRRQQDIPQDFFPAVILGSILTIKQLQKYLMKGSGENKFDCLKKELWKKILVSWLQSLLGPVELGLYDRTRFLKELENIDKTIEKMNSFNELCECIIDLHINVNEPESIKEIRKQIENILEND